MKALIIILTMALSSTGFANTSTAYGNCSGILSNYGHFTASTSQTATVQYGKILTEIHVFIFMGFLSGMEKANIVGANERHVVYENSKYQLAVPYVPRAGLYFKDKNAIDFPKNLRPTPWIKICDY